MLMRSTTSFYQRPMTPLYKGSNESVLGAILSAMQLKVKYKMANKNFTEWCLRTKKLLPQPNNHPNSYPGSKKDLKEHEFGLREH